MTTVDQVFSLVARQNEVVKRVKTGGIDIETALAGTQGILDGEYPLVSSPSYQLPSWYVSPQDQIERVETLNTDRGWGFKAADFPDLPDGELAPEEVWLLAVYLQSTQATFDEHVAVIRQLLAEAGRKLNQWSGLESDPGHLRLLGNKQPKPGLCWVKFSPYANWNPEKGHRVVDLWQQSDTANLAASEVLSALMLFPEWAPSMDGKKVPYANLPGYQFCWKTGWSHALYASWWSDDVLLKLNATYADYRFHAFASPCFREC